jgi:hypothetical protein
MSTRSAPSLVFVSILWLALACGAQKPAESAEPARSDGGAAADAAPKDGDGTNEAAGGAAADSDKGASASDGPKPTRTPEDIITAPDVVFLFSFNDSDPKKKAEEKCSQSAGDDAKRMNDCMARARKTFPADGHRFLKDDKEQWWWITVRQTGNRLVAIHRIPVDFADQTDASITLKPVGKDKGSAPMKPPAKVVFEVPNDYQIVLNDPEHGRLVYQAKVGIIAE